ncbi:unnamed protein product [Ectocarpus sp. CCAP 1310/34]|nr:unnamed protein product [Ectocarpus sp. CCAP 1310/34]
MVGAGQVESEKREARLKAEKEALSRACEQEEAELGNAWAVVEAAAGFAPEGGGGGGGDGGNNNGDKMQHLMAAAAGGGGCGAVPVGQDGVVGTAGAEAVNGSGEGGGQTPPGLLPGIAGEGNGTTGE